MDAGTHLDQTAQQIAMAAGDVIRLEAVVGRWADNETHLALLFDPPPLGEEIFAVAAETFERLWDKSMTCPRLARASQPLPPSTLFYAGAAIETDSIDGIHLTAAANLMLAEAIADKVEPNLAEKPFKDSAAPARSPWPRRRRSAPGSGENRSCPG